MLDKDYVCEDWGTENEWIQIRVTVKLDKLDDTVAVMNIDTGEEIRAGFALEIKAELGVKTREAYRSGDKDALRALANNDYTEAIKRIYDEDSVSALFS